jgi:hypothetical protein
MKTTTIKSIALIIIGITASIMLHAQTENTSERLITQLKNGTAPGLLFSQEKVVPPPAATNRLNEKESLITQIRKGTAAGMQFKPVAGGAAPMSAPAFRKATAPAQPMASEQQINKEQPRATAAPVVPKQE